MKILLGYFVGWVLRDIGLIVYIYFVGHSKNYCHIHSIELLCCQYNLFPRIIVIYFYIISISHPVLITMRLLYQSNLSHHDYVCVFISRMEILNQDHLKIQFFSDIDVGTVCFIWLLRHEYYPQKIQTTWNYWLNLSRHSMLAHLFFSSYLKFNVISNDSQHSMLASFFLEFQTIFNNS